MSLKNDITNDITDEDYKKKSINVYLDMDYNVYKKRNKEYILRHFEMIYNIFDDNFNDNLVKLYILLKKKLLDDNYSKYVSMLIDLCNYINSLDYVDQEEYLYVILKLCKINILINKLCKNKMSDSDNDISNLDKVVLTDNKYLNLIDINKINNNILECNKLISKENVVFEIFLIFINKENKHSYNNIVYISEKMSLDFFMYWSSEEIYKIISDNLNITKNRLLTTIKKYKNDFINIYNNKTKILKNLYTDQINTKYSLKFKLLKKNTLFDEVMTDIKTIDNQV